MLFNSYSFIFLFLPAAFLPYFYLGKKRLPLIAKGWLALASLVFYGYWTPKYIPLLLLSILFNFAVGETLTQKQSIPLLGRRGSLVLGVGGNLAALAYYKYSGFIAENFGRLLDHKVSHVAMVLPLGISFFTFTQIAYLVDCYRQEVKEYSLLNYILFVTFFPHLIAGPIIHHREMMPQFAAPRNLYTQYKNIARSCLLFAIGLFKKVIVADTFAVWANNGFDHTSTLTLFDAWGTSLSYTLQLYFDFSGYTDMAIGLALLFNIKLPINFNSPYRATNIRDFWNRWHITLSRFLRQYVYIPMGGNRSGTLRTCVNLAATCIIGGIWHGAAWTFIFWGCLHGTAMAVHRVWRNLGYRMNTIAAWFITFGFVNAAWVLFRARSLHEAINILQAMLGFSGAVLPGIFLEKFSFLQGYGIQVGDLFAGAQEKEMIVLWLIAGITAIFMKNSMVLQASFRPTIKSAIALGLLTCGVLLKISGNSEFIYFRF